MQVQGQLADPRQEAGGEAEVEHSAQQRMARDSALPSHTCMAEIFARPPSLFWSRHHGTLTFSIDGLDRRVLSL